MSTTDPLSPTGTVSANLPKPEEESYLSGLFRRTKEGIFGKTSQNPMVDSNAAADALGTPKGDTMLGGGYRKRRNVTRSKKVVGRRKTRGRR